MKTCLVTGASGGIGSEICRQLGRDGYALALSYCKNREAGLTLQRELQSMGCDAELFCADLSDATKAGELVRSAQNRFGHVDALVYCAGAASRGLFTDVTLPDWEKGCDLNLGSAFFTAQACAKQMVSRKAGSILFISSMWGVTGASCETAYSAQKAGMIGLCKALAKELGPSGIRVNCVAPGVIDTPMNGDLSPEDMKNLGEETPLGRIGTPLDVANAVSFLLSERACFITGQTLTVDGGFIL